MSFFDEADEPTRRAPRQEPRSRPASGRRRPPQDQSVRTRQIVAVAVLLVVVVLAAIGIHSCQVTQTDNALKDYNTAVNSLMAKSTTTGTAVFTALKGAASNEQAVTTTLDSLSRQASSQFAQGQGLNVPDQMSGAQQNLLLTLRMRRDALAAIAAQIQPALANHAREAALTAIAAADSNIFASDVIYIQYVVPAIASTLKSAGIPVGGANGQTLYGGQVITDLSWLDAGSVGNELGAPAPSGGGSHPNESQPGLHGHQLNSVSVGSTTLACFATYTQCPGVTSNATISASTHPTFTLSVTNSGDFNEYDVVCKVTVEHTNDVGTYTIPETTPKQTTTCPVTLPSTPAAGSYTVQAEVEQVPLETNLANNVLTFSVTFSG